LGGKLGEQVAATLGISTVGELAALTMPKLESVFPGGLGSKLWHLARGVDGEEVEERMLPKSMNCGKTFRCNHGTPKYSFV
jgi:DNA polymerase eta